MFVEFCWGEDVGILEGQRALEAEGRITKHWPVYEWDQFITKHWPVYVFLKYINACVKFPFASLWLLNCISLNTIPRLVWTARITRTGSITWSVSPESRTALDTVWRLKGVSNKGMSKRESRVLLIAGSWRQTELGSGTLPALRPGFEISWEAYTCFFRVRNSLGPDSGAHSAL